jgi:hypothetical protein
MQPCKITFTAVISVLSHGETVASAERAELLLTELETLWKTTKDPAYLPSAKTYSSVLNALAKSGSTNAIPMADDILERMESLYNETRSDDLRPNLVVFVQMLNILANSRISHAALKAKMILQKMNQLHRAGYPDVRPDATTFAYLINVRRKSLKIRLSFCSLERLLSHELCFPLVVNRLLQNQKSKIWRQ